MKEYETRISIRILTENNSEVEAFEQSAEFTRGLQEFVLSYKKLFHNVSDASFTNTFEGSNV